LKLSFFLMHTVDTLIHAKWILTVNKNNDALHKHTLVIDQNKIIDIVPSNNLQYQSKHSFDRSHHTLIPGLINAHSHAGMNLFKGLADDMPLQSWLYDHILPAETTHVDENFISDGVEIAIAEMIKSGTTCFNDMYYFPNLTAQLALKHGIRAAIGLIALDFPTIWADNIDEYLRKGIKLHDHYAGSSHIKPIFAPHSPYALSDESFKKVLTYAEQIDARIHMHIHETEQELKDSIQQHGARPLARLDALGLLSPNLIAVHMAHLKPQEMNRLKETNTHVVHCPTSNLKLASGICNTTALQQAGINTALGTDGSASNNSLDMIHEMKLAALLAKGTSLDASALDANTVLRMATINGAKALGWADKIGSLEIGKQADIVAIDTHDIGCQPHYNPVSQLVYSVGKQQVSDVWVDGKTLLKDRQLRTLQEDELLQRAAYWQKKIQP